MLNWNSTGETELDVGFRTESLTVLQFWQSIVDRRNVVRV